MSQAPKPTNAPAADYSRVFHCITAPRAENAKAADGRACYRQLFKGPFSYEAHAEPADGGMAAAQKIKNTAREGLESGL